MDVEPRSFIVIWIVAVVGSATLVMLFDGLIDPYLVFGVPRTASLNARKPAVDSQQYLMKAYDVTRATPMTLVLGSSRVEVGIDAHSAAWPLQNRPIYNLGLASGGPYVAYRYLQHVIARQHVSMVVLELEFQDFVRGANLDPPQFEARLGTTRDGGENSLQSYQYARDAIAATLSLDALLDSAATLSANLSEVSSDLVDGNWDFNFWLHVTAVSGSYPLITWGDSEYARLYRNAPLNMGPMRDVRAILQLCQERGIRVIAFIAPSHADELELLDFSGQWAALEAWKRELAKMVTDQSLTSGSVRMELWDFSGYDVYSTESVPMERRRLRWFWNLSHHTRALGDILLGRMFGTAGAPFGERINTGNIEVHLAKIREARALYRELHPIDARRVRDIYNRVVGAPAG